MKNETMEEPTPFPTPAQIEMAMRSLDIAKATLGHASRGASEAWNGLSWLLIGSLTGLALYLVGRALANLALANLLQRQKLYQ
jgi:hypothetical protein